MASQVERGLGLGTLVLQIQFAWIEVGTGVNTVLQQNLAPGGPSRTNSTFSPAARKSSGLSGVVRLF